MAEEVNVVSKEDLDLINQHTLKELKPEDVYIFKVQVCDNDIDRVGDKMTDNFLHQVAEHIKGVTGLKDHDWSVDNQLARLYDAEVVEDDTLTLTGEPRKYVLGKAYTLKKNKSLIDSIDAGLLKETSISFNSSGDICSICGEPMIKDENDVGHCKNEHIAGHFYDNKQCYNIIDKLDDILEWSLVAVPCQRKAGINKKELKEGGTSIMKKAEMLIRQFMSSKSYEQASEEDKKTLEGAVEADKSAEMSDDEIKELINENSTLKARVKELEDEVAKTKAETEKATIKSIVSKGIEDMHPLTDKVSEMIHKEIPWDDLKLEDGQIPGLDDVFAGIKKSFDGLFKSVEAVGDPKGKGCGDGDVEVKAETETEDTETKEETETEETKEKELTTPAPEVKSKGLNMKSGITFGVSQKSTKAPETVNKPGIYFN